MMIGPHAIGNETLDASTRLRHGDKGPDARRGVSPRCASGRAG